MEVLSNLKAACTRQAIIFENKDRYALGANMVRAVFGYRAVHCDTSINTSIFISEGKKKGKLHPRTGHEDPVFLKLVTVYVNLSLATP
jgi:hypothetical protein